MMMWISAIRWKWSGPWRLDFKPIEIIKFAQVANGILLPVISGFLLWVMNSKKVLGTYVNNRFQNLMGFIIFGVTLFLGLKSIWSVFRVTLGKVLIFHHLNRDLCIVMAHSIEQEVFRREPPG